MHLHSHSIALGMGALMCRVPAAVSVDVTVGDWWAMPAWRKTGRRAAAELIGSRAAERRTFRTAALVLAWTGWGRRAVEAAEPRARVVEHHPGLDLTKFTPAPQRRERTLPRILFVGGRWEDKGGADLWRRSATTSGRPSSWTPSRPPTWSPARGCVSTASAPAILS